MKTIIVATDYSGSSEVALKYAAFLARFTKTKIALLNVYSFNIHALNGLITPAAMDRVVEDNQRHLEEYVQKLSSNYEVSMSVHTLTSADEETLEEFAKKINAGLIVMGMKKDSEERLSGNVSTAIINNTRLPVLVIPDGVTFKLPERLLYACDYYSLPDDNHLDELKELATAFGAELQIFHVSKIPVGVGIEAEMKKAVVKKIENSVSMLKHTYCNKNAKDIIDGIKEGINEFKADILVMSPHKYGFWRSLFHKSKTREMALQSTVPLLSLASAKNNRSQIPD